MWISFVGTFHCYQEQILLALYIFFVLVAKKIEKVGKPKILYATDYIICVCFY